MKQRFIKHLSLLVATVLLTTCVCASTMTANTPVAVAADNETTTTTTAVACYATQLSYDRSPMAVGETRAIQFYHPVTKVARGGSVDTTSTNIAISYEDGSDTVYVTALAEGEAKLYIRESDCAFGAYAYLTIEGVEVGCFPKGDVNHDGKLTTGDARLVLSYCLSGVMPLSDDWLSTADFDGNGKIETGDARRMLATTIDLI